MASLKFLIDTMCANFTVDSLCGLVKARLIQGSNTINDIAQAKLAGRAIDHLRLTRGSCSISDITDEIMQRDRTLDIMSAETLAQAAVEALVESGDVAMQGADIYRAG